jgi:hypothetical protein
LKSALSVSLFAFALLSAVLAGGGGCTSKDDGEEILGPKVLSTQEISPAAPPGEYAVLVLAGTRFPVEIATKSQDRFFTIELKAHGEVLETERYVSTVSEFALLEAALETYRPPLPLLRFPMAIGESWTWAGTLGVEDTFHSAEATIATSQGKLNAEGHNEDALTVRVQLKIDGDSGQPAIRNLAFWFVPGKGILRREFGHSSTRMPRPLEQANGL